MLLLPNICGYVTERYDPTRPEVLLAPARGTVLCCAVGAAMSCQAMSCHAMLYMNAHR